MQVLPSVAWVPAAIVWFGLSDATVYFVVLMGAIPSIVNGMLAEMDAESLEVTDVADRFLKNHADVWTKWVPADVAERVKAGL